MGFKTKKGIGPVVAISLLLIVSVVSVLYFQGWFQTFSSVIMANTEIKSNGALGNDLRIVKLIGTKLYVLNNIVDNLSITTLEIGNNICNISGQGNLDLGMNEFDISSCLDNLTTSVPRVLLTTNKTLVEKSVLVQGITYSSCSLDGLSVNHGSSAIFYNSSSGNVCNGILRTCDDGTLNGSNSFNHSTCIVISSSLTCITDTDGDGQILWTCANDSMTNTTLEGHLDVNDNNSTIIDDKCWLKDDKDSCESNLIVDGCGSDTVLDIGTNFCWQRNMSTAGTMNWTDAKTYCTGLSLGGHSDWRLPSRQELFTITDLSRYHPAIIGGNGNKFTNVQNNYYWTISTYGAYTSYARAVYFYHGNDHNSHKANYRDVGCVR